MISFVLTCLCFERKMNIDSLFNDRLKMTKIMLNSHILYLIPYEAEPAR